MNYLLDVILCSGVVAAEVLLAFIGVILIQAITYRITGFSIYKYLLNKILD